MRVWPWALALLIVFLSIYIVELWAITHYSKAPQAYAWDNETISIDQIAENLGTGLGFTGAEASFTGGIILGLILLFIAMLPTAFIVRKANTGNTWLMIVGVSMVSANIALGLFPWWLLLILSMLIALMFASNIRSWLSGS